MSSKQKHTHSSLIFMSSALIICAVLALLTIYFNSSSNDEPTAFFARNIHDASYDCEDKIIREFKDQLISKYYDEISSRYDAKKHQYIIYYRVGIRTDENGLPVIKDVIAKCSVWEKLGYVSDFHIIWDL